MMTRSLINTVPKMSAIPLPVTRLADSSCAIDGTCHSIAKYCRKFGAVRTARRDEMKRLASSLIIALALTFGSLFVYELMKVIYNDHQAWCMDDVKLRAQLQLGSFTNHAAISCVP